MLPMRTSRACCQAAAQQQHVLSAPRPVACHHAAAGRVNLAPRLGLVGCPNVPTLSRSKIFPSRISAAVADAPVVNQNGKEQQHRPLRVIIAGAGIGGLVLAVALLKQGVDVKVFERDLTAIRGEGKYRGPIQVQSNALAALEAIDVDVCNEVLRQGCITGDRINGLCDGETGDWYIKFDTYHPAVDKGLPVTRVISRITLQEILADACERIAGPNVIENSSNVVAYEELRDPASGKESIRVTLEDGRTASGDLLIGADGIWSKVRKELVGNSPPVYSGYTCYTGISDFTPPDLEIVGYRVFLGNGQYFVSSDVGGGKQQWYGFHKEPADGSDPPGKTRKARLLEIFGHWCSDVTDLIKATPEADILRRDISDRPPIFRWSKGRVALLGDSAHAMQPNLGQGGCMAIEDAFQLGRDVAAALKQAGGNPDSLDVPGLWGTYQSGRLGRAAAIHGMARFAAIMASTYKAYLGEGLGPLEWIKQFQIPHPARVIGRLVLHATMPAVLGWVLGGNNGHLEAARPSACRVEDRLKCFSEADFATFLHDDQKLLRAAHARWMLLCEREPTCDSVDADSNSEAKGVFLSSSPRTLGSSADSDLLLADTAAAAQHARAWRDEQGDCYLEVLPSSTGTWVNGKPLQPGHKQRLLPQDMLEFGAHPASEVFRVKMQHLSLATGGLNGHSYTVIPVGSQAKDMQPSPVAA
ncbi:zeaxanthin epoxidase precursor [Scenedesmus sp. NREL 46B-D3]|nr:zeaxanthin epoxidase precursor [Scenedesmus sp. NREL 46B-D3]